MVSERGVGGRIQQRFEAHCGGSPAAGKGLWRGGGIQHAVEDYAVVTVVGGVAVPRPVLGREVELHVPSHQPCPFPVDEGVPKVGPRLGASTAGVEDSNVAAFGGLEVFLTGCSFLPKTGEQGLRYFPPKSFSPSGFGGMGWGAHGELLYTVACKGGKRLLGRRRGKWWEAAGKGAHEGRPYREWCYGVIRPRRLRWCRGRSSGMRCTRKSARSATMLSTVLEAPRGL